VWRGDVRPEDTHLPTDTHRATVIGILPILIREVIMTPELLKAKVLLLGDGAVGKTSLIRRFVVDQFSDDYITTVGTKVSKKDLAIKHDGVPIEIVMQIWDVLGQRGYAGVQETALKGAKGALMVYDLTRDETRRALEEYWVPMLWRLVGKVPLVFAGNKVDLVADKVKAHELLGYLSQRYEAVGLLSSARTGEHVEEAFVKLAQDIAAGVGKTAPKVALPTFPQEPVDIRIAVADRIMTDFCAQMGSVDAGMPVVKRQFEIANVDVRAPSKESLMKVVDLLADVEKDFKPEQEVKENKKRRAAWLADIAAIA
jgi:small GTP-binding protein